ncbi:MAG TPA: methyltransferase domain-containing protein [Bryobacteraceae bacterium]|jgi:SAM-dependent methyltransferase|nr:methyltransferase domain-containing protein [Bryobacteraceae bacterium]
MFGLSKRLIEPELLDHADLADAQVNLQELVLLNKRFGGHSTIRKLLQQAALEQKPFTLLDVGAASGDSGRLIREIYPQARVTNFDCNAVNLANAPHPKLIGDAFRMPFSPASFDYVFCSLLLHHFKDAQVTELLRDFGRIARQGVLICDLERNVLPYLFMMVSQPLFRWHRITVHDGQTSFRAALSAAELLELAKAAGLPNPDVKIHRPAFRLTLIAQKASA